MREESGANVVQNMHLVAIDAVADPSFPKAFVNGILESKHFVVEQDGSYEESYDNFTKSIEKLPRKEVDAYLRQQVLKFISGLN